VPDSSLRLGGRTALVTGAGGDIGAAIAIALAEAGAAVGVVGRRAPALRRVLKRLQPVEGVMFVTDLTSDDGLRKTVRGFLERFGGLDMLVHSNGIHVTAPLEQAKVADFDRLWRSNVRSPFILTQLLLPSLRASAGQIVFVNSSIGLDTRPGVGQFSATQHALRALADTLRAEVNPAGIRVLNIYPGRTATKRQEKLFEQEGRQYQPDRLLQPTEIARVVVESLMLPRTAEVTDIRIRPTLNPSST
jgi:NADP-dependent 3-hydroxy acid dehydrogenase YdfG